MSRRIAVFAAMAVLATAACNSKKKQDKNNQATVTAPSDTALQIITQNAPAFADWQDYYVMKMPDFQLNNFQPSEYDQQLTDAVDMELNTPFFAKYGKLLVYNADSSRFIDIFSYNLMIEKDRHSDSLVGRTGDPDQEVAVVDAKTGKRKRIWFCGPSCLVQKAVWLNEQEIALMGVSDTEGDYKWSPFMVIMNTQSGKTTMYNYPKQIANEGTDSFIRAELQKKGIKYEG